MTAFTITDTINHVDELWEKVNDVLKKRFNLFANYEALQVELDDSPCGEDVKKIIGLVIDDGAIRLPPDFIDHKEILTATLAREAMLNALPSNLEESIVADDLAWEYGRQMLTEQKQQAWIESWKVVNPPQANPTGYPYRPQEEFILLWKLKKEKALEDLVKNALKMVRYGTIPTPEEWHLFLYKTVMSTSASLSLHEGYIIDTLLKNPTTTVNKIAERIGLTEQSTRKKIRSLKERTILNEYEYVVLSKIRFRLYNITLEPDDDPNIDVMFMLRHCPFTYSITPILTGNGGIIATLCIPDNKTNLRHVYEIRKISRNYGINCEMFERYKSSTQINLNDYDYDKGDWSIEWNLLQMEAEKMQREELAIMYPQIQYSYPPDDVSFDRLDLQIIDKFQRGFKNVRQIREALGIRLQIVTERLKRLRSLDVIRKFWEIRHLGLNEEINVTSTDKKVAKCISSLALRLPHSRIEFDRDETLFMGGKVPSGGTYGLITALSSLVPRPRVRLVGKRLWGVWNLTKWLPDWDLNTGRWKETSIDLNKWIDSMEHGPEYKIQ